jgi:hypothetical protein
MNLTTLPFKCHSLGPPPRINKYIKNNKNGKQWSGIARAHAVIFCLRALGADTSNCVLLYYALCILIFSLRGLEYLVVHVFILIFPQRLGHAAQWLGKAHNKCQALRSILNTAEEKGK